MGKRVILIVAMLPCVAILAIFLAGVANLMWESVRTPTGIGIGGYIEFFQTSYEVQQLIRTLYIAALVSSICLVVGFPIAYFLSKSGKNTNILLMLIIVPWLVSIVVRSYGWVVLLGPQGTLNSLMLSLTPLDEPIRMVFNTIGTVIGLVHVFFPFMIFSILNSLVNINDNVANASSALGANAVQRFVYIIVPLSMPGIVTGVTIVFLLSSGAVVTPLLLGGIGGTMLSTSIYLNIVQLFDFKSASIMSIVLVVCAFFVVWTIYGVSSKLSRHH